MDDLVRVYTNFILYIGGIQVPPGTMLVVRKIGYENYATVDYSYYFNQGEVTEI